MGVLANNIRWMSLLFGEGWLVLFLQGVSLAAEAVETPRFSPLNLTPFVQTWFSNAWPGSVWSAFPSGSTEWEGIPFTSRGSVRLLGLADARQGDWAPAQTDPIPVGKSFQTLHVLHTLVGSDRPGTPTLSLVFSYADGIERTVRFVSGVHAIPSGSEPRVGTSDALLQDPLSQIVWSNVGRDHGENLHLRVGLSHVSNPRPDQPVSSITFLSLFPQSTPVLLGLTMDSQEWPAPAGLKAYGRWERKAQTLPDATLRHLLVIRARSAEEGAPLTNAEVFLSIRNGEQAFFFDRIRVDREGKALMHYPPSETVAYQVWVRAPGRVPTQVEESKTQLRAFSPEHVLRLPKGKHAGGHVEDSSGKPVAGAVVRLKQRLQKAPREYAEAEWDMVKTAVDGSWGMDCLPETITGLFFEVVAPDSDVRVFALDPSVLDETHWSVKALDSNSVKVVVPKTEPLKVHVANAKGTPLESAIFFAGRRDGRDPVAIGRTDEHGDGLVSWSDLEEEGGLLLAKPGYAPTWENVERGNPLKQRALQVVLQPQSILTGQVMDQERNPVPGAEVRLESWNDTELFSFKGVTDSEGKFFWSNAVPGMLRFRLSKPFYSRARTSQMWQAGRSLQAQMQRLPMTFGKVVDANTGAPLPDFNVVAGYAFNTSDPIRWERYNSVRGRNGTFAMRLNQYGGSNVRMSVMVEAAGYLPLASPAQNGGTWTTNEFRLHPGKGVSGVLLNLEGKPLGGVSVMLLDPRNALYLDRPPHVSRSSSVSDQVLTDKEGRFEFQPRLESGRVVALDSTGVADKSASEVQTSHRLQLQAWGRVEGVFRVGDGWKKNQWVRLMSASDNYGSTEEPGSGIDLGIRTTPDAQGHFVFDHVPPGGRRVFLEYKFNDYRNGPVPLSHGTFVSVEPGKTATVTLGGGGRRVVGKVRVLGGDPESVDWLADVHQLTAQPAPPPGYPSFPALQNPTPDEMANAQRRFEQKVQAFFSTPAGKQFREAQRTYCLVFDTNGTFYIDNVLPGKYQLRIAPNEHQADYYNYRELGSLNHEVVVPAGGAQENQIHDLGTLDLTIRGQLRVGKPVPPFELQTTSGQKFSAEGLKGKVVLLYFWASWANPEFDLQSLKSIRETYAQDDRLVMLTINVDSDKKQMDEALKQYSLPGLACFAGGPNPNPIVMALGLDSFPAALILDAEGRLVGSRLRSNSIKNTIVKALRAKTPSTPAVVPSAK